MRWTRPRRGSSPTWLEDGGDALLLPGAEFESYETDKADGLALRLAQATPDRAGMMAFTARYGLLDNQPIHDGRLAGSLADWLLERANTRFVLASWFGDAPDVPHDPLLRAAFAGEADQRRDPVRDLLNDELGKTNPRPRLRNGGGFWWDGPTLRAQLWGELAIRVDKAQPFALCARCGSPFAFERTTGMYCSDVCRVMASRERRAA